MTPTELRMKIKNKERKADGSEYTWKDVDLIYRFFDTLKTCLVGCCFLFPLVLFVLNIFYAPVKAFIHMDTFYFAFHMLFLFVGICCVWLSSYGKGFGSFMGVVVGLSFLVFEFLYFLNPEVRHWANTTLASWIFDGILIVSIVVGNLGRGRYTEKETEKDWDYYHNPHNLDGLFNPHTASYKYHFESEKKSDD